MGVVLKGHDDDLGRDVAIKMLQRRHAGDRTLLQRFDVVLGSDLKVRQK